ncbi:hypothetical protein NCCP1664_09410 [Zafaria cholistanensis]|uniref:Uncharacterized protein n=1 Tax=Zafaria cholistanensis TaxID=1682741 RepID=A0A5A7NNE2_9MICC|nr:hypothetical protein NCCP1664_09410 [Zafaria cholistanensis]
MDRSCRAGPNLLGSRPRDILSARNVPAASHAATAASITAASAGAALMGCPVLLT